MSGFRDKLQVFFLGLMLGLLIGGGFFILKLDNYFKELSFYKSSQDGDESKQDPAEIKTDSHGNQKKNTRDISTVVPKKTSRDSIMKGNDDQLAKVDTLAFSNDSISPMDKLPGDDEIIVRKDEMTAAQTIEIINLSLSASAGKNPKDSLLQQVSGIRDDAKSSFRVEFWRSPLNYKGYKMTRNKIVLYGISSSDPISIFKLEEDFYMKHLNTVYRLSFTNDFKQFEKVNDAGVLSRLNK